MADMPSNYARNVVTCKLSDLVASPPESILGVAIFSALSGLYDGWRCWVYSGWEYRTFGASQTEQQIFALLPQLEMGGVGRVDFAIFVPQLNSAKPLLVIEVDGHDYHERTPDQANSDNRRDRALQWLGVVVLRFTATYVLRDSAAVAHEVAQFVDIKLQENAAREAERAAAWNEGFQYGDLLS